MAILIIHNTKKRTLEKVRAIESDLINMAPQINEAVATIGHSTSQ